LSKPFIAKVIKTSVDKKAIFFHITFYSEME